MIKKYVKTFLVLLFHIYLLRCYLATLMQNFGAFNNATTRRPFQLGLPPPPPPILNPALNKTVASESFMNFIYSSFTSAPLTLPHFSHVRYLNETTAFMVR